MNRGRDRRQVRLDSQKHYKGLEENHDAKASERFHTPPAYQSYSVEDYLRKMGVDITKGVDAGGARLEENNIKNENNRKKEYLRGYRSSRRRINRIDDEIIELKELAASVKAIDYSGMPHGNGNQNDLSDELARIDSLVEKLGAEKESCIESYVSIEKQIQQIKNEDENDVLFYRYIKGLRWWEISEKMDCSERWVHKLHGRALGHLKYPE